MKLREWGNISITIQSWILEKAYFFYLLEKVRRKLLEMFKSTLFIVLLRGRRYEQKKKVNGFL
jgi:hypothetical protein